MSALQVVAVLKAKSGSESIVRDALAGLVEPTLAEEGCLAYQLFESNVDASTFVTIEQWRSQEDLDGHMKTPHIATAMAAAGAHFSGRPEIHPLTFIA